MRSSDPKSVSSPAVFKRATIRDVAKKAGVSTTAVSFVMNGRNESIPLATQERVKKAALELHYRPHGLIRGLKNKRTHVIGSFADISSDIPARLHSYFMRAIQQGMLLTGYDHLLYRLSGKGEDVEPSTFLDGRIDGLLSWNRENSPLLSELSRLRFPVVSMFDMESPENIGVVGTDDQTAYQKLLKSLIGLGHEHMTFCHGDLRDPLNRSRFKSFHAAAAKVGLPLENVQFLPTVVYAVSKAAEAEFDKISPDSTAIFARYHEQAELFCYLAEKRGMSVPEDLSVIGYDMPGALRPENSHLTTILSPVNEVGIQAVQMLDEIITGAAAGPRVMLPVEILPGSSVGQASKRKKARASNPSRNGGGRKVAA